MDARKRALEDTRAEGRERSSKRHRINSTVEKPGLSVLQTLAGNFDGDGCIGYYRGSDTYESFAPHIIICQESTQYD
jgi:hypothetical protein